MLRILPHFFGKKPHNTTSIAAFFACELRQYPPQIRTPELISASLIKKYHYYLKRNTVDELREYLVPGEYKLRPNTVGNIETADPAEVSVKMEKLLDSYNSTQAKTI